MKNDSATSDYPAEMTYGQENSAKLDEIVNLFANYFEKSYNADSAITNIEEIYGNVQENITNEINVSMFDVEKAINKLKPEGSVGPDEIHPRVIKECVDSLIFPIWLLLQMSFNTGKIPDALKSSRITPLHKKGDRSNVENNRIIAISSVILKFF